MEKLTDNYYEFIGVQKFATPEQIKNSIRKLLIKYHPDKNKETYAEGITRHIYIIRDVLLNPQKRQEYDKTLPFSDESNRTTDEKSVCIIGIGGRSCSGKSVVAKRLEAELSNIAVRICQDRFFKKQALNWEAPEALNNYNLIYSLKKLKRGAATHIPSAGWTEVYDRLVEPKPLIIVEGYLLFENMEIVELLDKKIYIDVSDVNMLYRRTKRDNTSRNIDYTMFTVIPESKKYMDKQKKAADIIIDGNRDKDTVYKDVCRYLNI